jgi:cobalt/nickel transport system ATP-binding protein
MIDLENIIYSYEGVTALDNITLHIEKGEAIALMGPHGAVNPLY